MSKEDLAAVMSMGKSRREAACTGTGTRFKALTKKLSKKKGVTDPKGLAAKIGRDKYGAKKMAKWAAKGRKK